MEIEKVNKLGMELEQWTNKSCVAEVGVGDTWATVYYIESKEEGKGHATELLKEAKKHYEGEGKVFGSSVALNERMRHLLVKLNIKEYVEN
jgi:hypothetical protein